MLRTSSAIYRLLLFSILMSLFFFLPSSLTGSPDSDKTFNIRSATVKIIQTYIDPDYDIPWKMKNPGTLVGSGAIIQGNKVITNAHIVSNSTYIKVQKENDPETYDAEISFIGHDCDLALLTVRDRKFFNNTIPLKLGGIPELRSSVTTYGYPEGGGRISITEGVVSRIEIGEYAHQGSLSFLTIQTDAAINPGNSGGPVIQNNEIVGVAFQASKSSENIGYMIPVPIIKHFLDDIKDGKYDGFPTLGIFADHLENISYRKYLGMTDNQTGIIIRHVIDGAGAERHLQREDVIMSIDSTPLANDGSIKFMKGRIFYSYLVDRKQIGDPISLSVFRKGKTLKISYRLRKFPFRIHLYNDYDRLPRYIIFGGIIFQTLSKEYLKTWDEWWYKADLRMVYYYSYYLSDRIHTERKEFVLINQVLPDEANTYISGIKDYVVREINGMPINRLEDVSTALKNPKGDFHIILLDGITVPIILRVSQMDAANRRIKNKYRIPSLIRL